MTIFFLSYEHEPVVRGGMGGFRKIWELATTATRSLAQDPPQPDGLVPTQEECPVRWNRASARKAQQEGADSQGLSRLASYSPFTRVLRLRHT